MDKGLRLDFILEKNEVIFGESIRFNVVLSHVFPAEVSVTTFKETNRSLVVTLKGTDGQELTADQLAYRERDGLYTEEPRELEGTSLPPGGKLELSGDLLRWFGNIPSGIYTVYAEYTGIMRVAVSEPVQIRIFPAMVLSATVPRWGLQVDDASYTAAWIHSQNNKAMLFYQQQSPYLPRNPWLCVRTALDQGNITIGAACIPDSKTPLGHLHWLNSSNKLFFCAVDLKNGVSGPVVAVNTVYSGKPLQSALSMADGSMLLPFTDEKKENFSLLHIAADGKVDTYDLDLGVNSPLGAYVCFWEHDQRLHFVWTKPRGRQLDYAMLPLEDLSAGFSSRTIYIANDPLLWIDAYLDNSLPVADIRSLYLAEEDSEPDPEELEPLPPSLYLWCISEMPGRLACMPVSMQGAVVRRPVFFSTSGINDLRIISSVVTYENEFVFLAADSGGKLYYASTAEKNMKPVGSISDQPINESNFPALIKAGPGGNEPWVYLRFVTNQKEIDYIKLEPADEADPFEQDSQSWAFAENEDEFTELE